MKKNTFIIFIIGLSLVVFIRKVEAQKLGSSFSLSVGYWKPSLEQVNNALDLWAKMLDEAEITPQGEDKFSGTFTAEGAVVFGINERTVLRADLSYWKKTIQQKIHAEFIDSSYDYYNDDVFYEKVDFKGEAEASIKLIPVMFSGQYYLGDASQQLRPYLGGGFGLVFADIDVNGYAKQNVTSYYYGESYTDNDNDAFKADHSSSNIILQIFGGIEFVSTDVMAFFVEAKYLSGNFNVEQEKYDIDEDVSISGWQIKGGMRFYLRN